MRHVSDAIHKCLILKNAQKYNAIYDQDIESCIPYTWEHFKERNKKELSLMKSKREWIYTNSEPPLTFRLTGVVDFIVI